VCVTRIRLSEQTNDHVLGFRPNARNRVSGVFPEPGWTANCCLVVSARWLLAFRCSNSGQWHLIVGKPGAGKT